MKKYTLLYIALIKVILLQAQVGIGTKNPVTDLHVDGDVLIQNSLNLGSLSSIDSSEEDFKLLTRVPNSTPPGEIKILDTDNLAVAPISTMKYIISNVNSDNVGISTRLRHSKYLVAISNIRILGSPIIKEDYGTTKSIGNFWGVVIESGAFWSVQLKNVFLECAPGESLEYEITLSIFDKKYFRSLPFIVTDLGGNNSGAASSIPVLN